MQEDTIWSTPLRSQTDAQAVQDFYSRAVFTGIKEPTSELHLILFKAVCSCFEPLVVPSSLDFVCSTTV